MSCIPVKLDDGQVILVNTRRRRRALTEQDMAAIREFQEFLRHKQEPIADGYEIGGRSADS